VRLGVLSALAVASPVSFVELKESLGLSDGNLSVHARKLEEAGYIECAKRFEGRVPRTEFSITTAGRDALGAYLDHMESIIRATRR
jgi:DNA-binding transcriptional ArsR family regulator